MCVCVGGGAGGGNAIGISDPSDPADSTGTESEHLSFKSPIDRLRSKKRRQIFLYSCIYLI